MTGSDHRSPRAKLLNRKEPPTVCDRPTPGHGQGNDLGYETTGPVARVRDVAANDERKHR